MYIGCPMPNRLSHDDRDFFGLVSEATFSNPFGDERAAIDLRIAERYGAPGGGPELERLLAHLDTRLAALAAKGRCTPALYDEPDRLALEHAVLFDAFHRFTKELDLAIVA